MMMMYFTPVTDGRSVVTNHHVPWTRPEVTHQGKPQAAKGGCARRLNKLSTWALAGRASVIGMR